MAEELISHARQPRDSRSSAAPRAGSIPAVIRLLSPELALARDALLRSYAQIFFGRSLLVGLLLLLATAVSPRLLLMGCASVMLSLVVARLMHLPEEQQRSGLLGYNALLVGLGGAALLQPSPAALGLLVLAVVGTVFATAALNSALGAFFNLPVLTLPFLAVFPLLLAGASTLGVGLVTLPADPLAPYMDLPAPLILFLQSLGAVFFLPRVDAGLLVFAGLICFSRIGALLAVMGFAISQVMGVRLPTSSVGPLLPMMLGYNFIFTTVALGGVWFVPSISSFVLGAVGALEAGLITAGLLPLLSGSGVPPLILPFNMTVLMMLYAMRQRVLDRRPKSVDFLLGTPEENLSYFRTRLSRFGANYFIRFGAPFLGRWICTQGVDGEHTHQGPWRHALDFEVQGADGQKFQGLGNSLEDYHCYGLPVLAAADGTVAKVLDGVEDNPLGQVNLEHNWGNLVLLFHAPGLYSMVCHLSPGSIKVQEGQPVRRGDALGHCGNSGRSAEPHIHWQLQATARVGAPTLKVELHDVLSEVDRPIFHSTLVPAQGEVVRNLEPQEDLARLLRFSYGETLCFAVNGVEEPRQEIVMPDIDLYGNLLLRSESRAATLFYDNPPGHFTVFDTLGRRGSVLHLMQAALSRVPFECVEALRWQDTLPLRLFLPWWARIALDMITPFVADTGILMTYQARRQGRRVKISGRSERTFKGRPLLLSEAVLHDRMGIEELTLDVRGRRHHARRIMDQQNHTNT